MLSQDEITAQEKLLAAHRRTLAMLLQQYALLGGAAHAPPGLLNSIEEARINIARIKMALRDADVQVDDEANDEIPPTTEPSTLPAATATTTFRQPNWKVSGNVSKVAGDQRNINTSGGDYAEGTIDKRRGIFWDRAHIPLIVLIVIVLLFAIASIITAGASVRGFKETLQSIGVLPSPSPTAIPTSTILSAMPGELVISDILVYSRGNGNYEIDFRVENRGNTEIGIRP
jgi:hypothetical protein